MTRFAVAACVTAMMGLPAAPGLAQGTSVQRAACTPDVFRFCSGEIPNVERITACLRREKTKLSSGCQSVFDGLAQTKVATRSIEASPAGSPPDSPWCAPADPSLSGQEIWIAWCRAGAAAE